jgi:hypothetical protein
VILTGEDGNVQIGSKESRRGKIALGEYIESCGQLETKFHGKDTIAYPRREQS